jgi:hypothetical protein
MTDMSTDMSADAAARLNARVAAVRKKTAGHSIPLCRSLATARPPDGLSKHKTDSLQHRLRVANLKNRELVAVAHRVNAQLQEAETRYAREQKAVPLTDSFPTPDVLASRQLVRQAKQLNRQLQLRVRTAFLPVPRFAVRSSPGCCRWQKTWPTAALSDANPGRCSRNWLQQKQRAMRQPRRARWIGSVALISQAD